MIKLGMFSYNFLCTTMSDIYCIKRIINLKGKLQRPFYFFKISDAPYLACSLVAWNTTWFWVAEELVNWTAIIDHSNKLSNKNWPKNLTLLGYWRFVEIWASKKWRTVEWKRCCLWISPCIMCFQYIGAVQYIGGYHEFIGGCP